jgi:branched-chain amino acid transport system permease protein
MSAVANAGPKRFIKPAALVLLAIVVVALPFFGSSFQVGVASRIAVFALFGLAFNVVFGAGGMPSLGHAAFFGLGGYLVGIGTVRLDWSFPSVLLLAIVLGAVLGALVGVLTLRSNGVYLLLLTLAVVQALWGLAFQQVRWTGGDNGIAGIARGMIVPGEASAATFYWSILAIVTFFGALVWWYQRSPAGVAVVAHRESPSRLAALGYRVSVYRVGAFTVSGSVAAVAGVLYAVLNRFVGPENLAWTMSAEVMLFAIVGGAAFFAGPIIGAALLVTLEVWVSGFTDRWLSVLGLTYILTMLFLPQGVLGLVDDLRRGRQKRRAAGEGPAVVGARGQGTSAQQEVPS